MVVVVADVVVFDGIVRFDPQLDPAPPRQTSEPGASL